MTDGDGLPKYRSTGRPRAKHVGTEPLAEIIPDRREFASDADRQRAILAHRRRIQRELRRRRG